MVEEASVPISFFSNFPPVLPPFLPFFPSLLLSLRDRHSVPLLTAPFPDATVEHLRRGGEGVSKLWPIPLFSPEERTMLVDHITVARTCPASGGKSELPKQRRIL